MTETESYECVVCEEIEEIDDEEGYDCPSYKMSLCGECWYKL